MEINSFIRVCILTLKLICDELHSLVKVVPSLILGVRIRKRVLRQLLLKEIPLVQKDDHRRLGEPLVVAHLLEQLQRLVHTVGRPVLVEGQVVLAQRNDKDHGRHVLEAVHPLAPLVTLPADINELEFDVIRDKLDLGDTGRLDTNNDDVIGRGNVVGCGDAVDVLKKAIKRIPY